MSTEETAEPAARPPLPIDYTTLFATYDRIQTQRLTQTAQARIPRNALQKYMAKTEEAKTSDGFKRIEKCREALNCIDRQGYQRSFHQRIFHDNFIRACARIFWKTEPPGTFARCHQKILEKNGWDHLSQEILVSTPRRSAIKFVSTLEGKSPRPSPRRSLHCCA